MLIALIALQSVDAMADAAKYHQPNSQYAEADYFVNIIATANLADFSNNSTQNNDADHCCACHAPTSMQPLSHELFFTSHLRQTNITNTGICYLSQLISPDLRPPIINT